jgi:hypothetical protein
MASDTRESDVPPVGEEIHLPGNSAIPLLMAVGITLALIGVTTFPIISVVGTLIVLWTLVRWIRDTRHDIDELPEHH